MKEQPTQPSGDADAGKGEGDDAAYELVQTDRGFESMRIFDLDELANETEGTKE